MYNPWDVEQFRAAIQSGVRDSFDGVAFTHARARISSATGECIEPAEPRQLETPQHIFGTPEAASCLDGIGRWEFLCPAKILHRVRHGTVLGRSSVLGPEGELYWPDQVCSAGELRRAIEHNANNSHGYVLQADDDDAATAFFFWAGTPRRADATALFLPDPEPGNYGSFLFRVLPHLLLAARLRLQFDLIIAPDRSHWLLDALRLLDLPQTPILTTDETPGLTVRELLFFNDFAPEGFFSTSTQQEMRALAKRLAPPEVQASLYVSRALGHLRTPHYRRMQNEFSLEADARSAGFAVVYPETLRLPQQIRLFAGARRIVGPSGSGMLNAGFAAEGSRVLDMESFTVNVRQHAKIYSATGKEYSFGFGSFVAADTRDMSVRDWTMPPAVFKAGVDWLMAD